jgi:uncharacterized protein YndB with AHSA1/START domain
MTTEITSIDAPDGLGYDLRIDAPPEVVWRFWVEPEQMVRWMGKVATLEPRPGGTFRIDYGQGDVVAGEYLEVDVPHRLALTWGWESPDGRIEAGRVEVTLEPLDAGAATLLGLRHLGLDADSRTGHDEGWRHFLPRLSEAVAASSA